MKRRVTVLLTILGIIVVVLLALQTPLLASARSVAWGTVVAVTGNVAGLGPLQLGSELQTELETLRAENIRLRAQEQDYERLRKQLGSASFEQFRQIEALVAGRPVDVWRTQLVLNRGAKDGVVLQAPVVANGSVLVGFIAELHERSAVLQLLLHPSVSLPAEVVGEEVTQGLVQGRAYTAVALTTVPRDRELLEGQAIVTSAQEGIPHGLLIGKVQQVRREENEAYQEAGVELPYDPDELAVVVILVAP